MSAIDGIDVHTLAELGLSSIGFFTVPEVSRPPENNRYSFDLIPHRKTDEKAFEIVSRRIGSSICEDISWTKAQKSFAWISSGCLAGATCGTLMIYFGGGLAIGAGAILTLASLIIGTSSLIKYYISYDLDNPNDRDNLRSALLSWNFSKLTKEFSIDDVINYDLLKNRLHFFSPEDKARVYTELKTLSLEKKDLDFKRDISLKTARNTYEIGIKELKHWIQDCRTRSSIINWGRLAKHKDPSIALEAVTHAVEAALETKYMQLKSPWTTWKSYEELSIQQAYEHSSSLIENKYQECLDHFQGTAKEMGA